MSDWRQSIDAFNDSRTDEMVAAGAVEIVRALAAGPNVRGHGVVLPSNLFRSDPE